MNKIDIGGIMKTKANFKKIIIFFCLLLFMLNVFVLVRDKIETVYEVYKTQNKEDGKNLSSLEKISQNFVLENNEIDKINLETSNSSKNLTDVDLSFEVLCGSEVLAEGNFTIPKLSKNDVISIFTNINDVKGKQLTLNLQTNCEDPINLKCDKNNNISISVVSKEANTYTNLVNVIGILLILFSCIVYLLVFVMNIGFHKMYLIAVIVLGSLISFIIPIGNVPDESNAHMIIAYHYSNVMLGINDDMGNVKIRQCDKDMIYNYTYVNNEKLLNYVNDFDNHENLDMTLVDSKQNINPAIKLYSYTYYLSALGITVGRLFGLNGILCILLARLFNFILFVIVSCVCIKNIPAYKSIMAFVCLLPMTLQQAFSVSYDSIVLSLALIITTLTIRLFYNDYLIKKEKIILLVSIVLISLCKGFSYAPIMLVPLSYFIKKINFKELFQNKKRNVCFLGIGILFCIILLFVFMLLKGKISEGSILYLLVHPVLFLDYMRNTIYANLESYIASSLADSMGLFSIRIYGPILVAYYMLIPYLLFNHDASEKKLPDYTRITIFVVFAICFIGILLAMYSWSYRIGLISNNVIVGFQGRYLLPVLPLFLMGISNKGYILSDVVEKKTLFLSMVLAVLTIFSILITL